MKVVQNALVRSCGARFGQIAFLSVKVLRIVKLASNSLQNGKTARFPWKLTKRPFQVLRSTFWPNCICERQSSQDRHTGLKFSSKRGNSALSMKIVQTKRYFQVMRSTFWPNRICERLSSVIRHTGLKLSPKRENSALSMKIIQKALFRSWAASFGQIAFLSVKVLKIGNLPQILFKRENEALSMKIVQNALFRSCAARFGQIAFLRVKVVTIVTLASNSLQKRKTVRFSWKLYKTLFSGHEQHGLAKSNFWGSNFSKSLHLSEILLKTGRQCAFYENCTGRSFRSCAARFGQIASLGVIVFKFVTLAWNSRQNGKTVPFPWKLYKTLFSGHEQHVLAKSNLWDSNFSKSLHLSQILAKTGKQCAIHENCAKRSFQVLGSTFWPNRIFDRQSSHNRHTRLKFASKRKNSALSMKIVQNALFRSCAARFGQIAFLSVKVLKIVTLASNSVQNGKTVPFPWKLYKTLFSDHVQHVMGRSHFWESKFSQSSHWPQILSKNGKQCAFHKNCTKRSFQVMRSTFWPNRILERQSSQNRHTGLNFSP